MSAGFMADLVNQRFKGDLRWQSLPQPFELWVDGLEVPVMEEFGAGTAALHETDLDARRALLRDPEWRAGFKKQWSDRLARKAWHRDLAEPHVVGCPDETLVGKTFAEIAADRGVDPLDCFLDLQAEFGNDLRWYTVVGNERRRFGKTQTPTPRAPRAGSSPGRTRHSVSPCRTARGSRTGRPC